MLLCGCLLGLPSPSGVGLVRSGWFSLLGPLESEELVLKMLKVRSAGKRWNKNEAVGWFRSFVNNGSFVVRGEPGRSNAVRSRQQLLPSHLHRVSVC